MKGPSPMGHEYVCIVEEVGADVSTIKAGQFVGSFFASDNTCVAGFAPLGPVTAPGGVS